MSKYIAVPVEIFSHLVGMSEAHVSDIESGLEEGIYDPFDNFDIEEKRMVVDAARELCDDDLSHNLFFLELLDSVESLTQLADDHGSRTLVDLMYLQQAIMNNTFIDCYPEESDVLQVIKSLPSGDRWIKFVKIEQSK